MTIHPSPATFSIDAFLSAQERRDLLRFITCGSVDDGKSTLIGRLLYESKRLFDDQVTALEAESRKVGTQGGALDFALLVDGLAAEREQGITIDVAYRFFSTERRSFIVADTPGHEQYTRNMATGASTADLAILLVDARKGLTRQTRRHALLVSMLGIRHVVLAINKMDLVDWSREAFDAIMAEYRAFAEKLGFVSIAGIPLSALKGDNVVSGSGHAPWYEGPTLLAYLEEVDTRRAAAHEAFRFPVQWVNRPNADFRGCAGLVTSGSIRPGARLRVLPSGRETTLKNIVTFDGDLPRAVAGQAVTVTLADDVDVSRGDVLVSPDEPALVADAAEARLFWTGEAPLRSGHAFLLKIGTLTAGATVCEVRQRIDIETLEPVQAASLAPNDIGIVALVFDRPVPFDPYERSRDTGGFILIDRQSFDTVAIGLIVGPNIAAANPPAKDFLGAAREKPWRSLVKAVSWRVTGTLDTVVLAFLFTHDLKISAAIGLTEILTKIALYYGHERLWARIPFGLRREPAQQGLPN